MQESRAGSWGSTVNGAAASPGQGDPAHESEGKRRAGGDLLSYGQLYALWEKQNWKAHELDFTVDQEQWLTTPAESQAHTAWSLGSFYIGEERVTADLAPFLLAAPSGEVELFLATQLVDEARHTAFFDRFGGEVMALSADDLRGRMRELEATMVPAWHETFDGGLREVANRIKARPRRPRPLRGGDLHLPPDHRGRARHDRPAADPQVHGGSLAVSRVSAGFLPGGARRAPPHRLRGADS